MCSNTKTSTGSSSDDEAAELRRGPWTGEEDNLLIHYISCHGEGRWNLLANRSGLKRTGKSCRLRWLNYLKPDVKRGNLTPEEQLWILHLHSKWGNRWSKIAQYLPGRTDNEIKNYWRTRVQKQARHLKIDSNSREFQEIIRSIWMPRLLQKIPQDSSSVSMDSISLENLPDNHALQGHLATPPHLSSSPMYHSTQEPQILLNNQLFSTKENSSSSSSISSPESANFSQEARLQNIGCQFYYNQYDRECYNDDKSSYDMKILDLGTGISTGTIEGDIFTGEANWLGDDWDLGEIWK